MPRPNRDIDAASFRPDSILPFQMGLPALDAFPRKIWARLGARSVRAMQPSDMVHPLCVRLAFAACRNREISPGVAWDQLRPVSGIRDLGISPHHGVDWSCPAEGGRSRLARRPRISAHARNIGAYAYRRRLRCRSTGRAWLFPTRIKLAPRARAAVVTPAHQSPLCMSLSLPRRLALLDWAARNNAWIIEDDYDGEYRYVSRPLPALKSLDRDGRVLYAGTFSKVLFPEHAACLSCRAGSAGRAV